MPDGFLPPTPQGGGKDAQFFRNLRERALSSRDQDRPGGRTLRTTRGNAFMPSRPGASSGGSPIKRYLISEVGHGDYFLAQVLDGDDNPVGDQVAIAKFNNFRESNTNMLVDGVPLTLSWMDDNTVDISDGTNTANCLVNPRYAVGQEIDAAKVANPSNALIDDGGDPITVKEVSSPEGGREFLSVEP